MIPRAYLLVGAVALVLAALSGAYLKGRADGRAVILEQVEASAKRLAAAADKARARIDALSGEVAAARSGQTTEFGTIRNDTIRIIERPIYRDLCVDADGVGLLDRAAAAANRGLAGGAAFTPARTAGDAAR